MSLHEARSFLGLSGGRAVRWPIRTGFKALFNAFDVLHNAMASHLNSELIRVVLRKLNLLLLNTWLP